MVGDPRRSIARSPVCATANVAAASIARHGGFPSGCEHPGPHDRVRGDTGADVMIVGLFIPRCLVGDRSRYFDSQHLNDAIDDVARLMQGLMSYGGVHVMLYDRQCILRFVQFG
jgi:hypothetical protein